MKRIYAFAFDEEDYLSDKWRNSIRLIAFLLYDSIYNFYDDNCIPLNLNKNIAFNRIHEVGSNKYFLDSDYYDDGFINYEPFLINNKCFALTVDDDLISEKEIESLLSSVLNVIKVKCSVSVYSESYESKNKNDERNRSRTIELICNKIGIRFYKKNSLVKRLIYGSKNRKNMNCYGRY